MRGEFSYSQNLKLVIFNNPNSSIEQIARTVEFYGGFRKCIFISPFFHYRIVNFLDDEGNIIIPKEVRPIIDHGTTFLGNKKGAIRQFRYGNLHIREYRTHYSVHSDTVDPRIDPMGHLMLDSPELNEWILRLAKVAKEYLNAKKC